MIPKMLAILGLALFVFSGLAEAQSPTMFQWNRNTETDVDHYEMYGCQTSATCVPDTTNTANRMGANIPQPAIGTLPSMPIPAGSSGNANVIAVDLVGNKSAASNTVSFKDSQAPAAPTGLVTK